MSTANLTSAEFREYNLIMQQEPDARSDKADERLGLLIDKIEGAEAPARRIKYVCDTCGEEEGSIYWDATAYWDAEKQAFVASDDINDTAYCGTCGGENCADVVDMETGEKLKQGPDSWDYLPIAEADALWAAARAFHQAKRAEAEAQRRALETANLLAADRTEEPQTVHLHAFRTLPSGDQEHTNDNSEADGWATYVRTPTPNDPQQPFDLSHEQDHETEAAAIARAEELAIEIHADSSEYHYD